MLEMNDLRGRRELRRYFYGDISIGKILLKVLGFCLIPFFGIGLIILAFVYFGNFGNNVAERDYDEMVQNDIEFLKDRAVENLGMVDEELSLVDPIIATSLSRGEVNVWTAVSGKFSIFEYISNIITSILAIFGFGNKVPEALYRLGSDSKLRSSWRYFSYTGFTEEQVVTYECQYDIALGVIINEQINEVFYRDVDHVTYGDSTEYCITVNKKVEAFTMTNFGFVVPSGKWVFSRLTGDASILENQVTAVKNLIRSKKTDMA